MKQLGAYKTYGEICYGLTMSETEINTLVDGLEDWGRIETVADYEKLDKLRDRFKNIQFEIIKHKNKTK